MDVAYGSKDNEARIGEYKYHGGDHQKFIFRDEGDGYYSIMNVNSGKVMDVKGTGQGAEINQYTYHGGDNQLFKVVGITNGFYTIESKKSGMVLDMGPKGLIQYKAHYGNNQLFKFEEAEVKSAPQGEGDVVKEKVEMEEPIDNSPRIALDWGKKDEPRRFSLTGENEPDFFKNEYYEIQPEKNERDIKDLLHLRFTNAWGSPASFYEKTASPNVYKSQKNGNLLHILSENSFKLNGEIYYGYEKPPSSLPKIVFGQQIFNSEIKYGKNITGTDSKLALDLRVDYAIYRQGGKKAVYVTLGKNSIINPSRGGMVRDSDRERLFFLEEVTVNISPRSLDGKNGNPQIFEYGPKTSKLGGTDSESTTISLQTGPSVSASGPEFSASVGVSKTNTISINLEDFSIVDKTDSKNLNTTYKLTFTREEGFYQEPMDLVDTETVGNPTLAEIPERAKGNLPIPAHGVWLVNGNYDGVMEMEITVSFKIRGVKIMDLFNLGMGAGQFNTWLLEGDEKHSIVVPFFKVD